MAGKSFWGLEFDELPKMSKEDWVLLSLARQKKGRTIRSAVLMNEVFFFIKEFAPAMEVEFGFRGTGFGPFSKVAATAVEKLHTEDFISIQKNKNTGICYYSLTDRGNSRYESLCAKISKKEQERIKFAGFLAQRMGALGTQQYLISVHPEYVFVCTAGDASV